MSTTASLSVTGPGYNLAKTRELSELQLKYPEQPSFHDSHRDSCYIFVGGLDSRMTEGDVIIVFSQWGEVVDIKLIRDRETGQFKGFGFLAYEDQRSTDLAVDNANGMRLLSRNVRVDHVKEYVVTREIGKEDGAQPLQPALSQRNLESELSTNMSAQSNIKQEKDRVKEENQEDSGGDYSAQHIDRDKGQCHSAGNSNKIDDDDADNQVLKKRLWKELRKLKQQIHEKKARLQHSSNLSDDHSD